MKPLASDICSKFYLMSGNPGYYLEPKKIVEFFEWAYNEGKKSKDEPQDENCTCSGFCKGNSTHNRNPTKMELATT